MDGAYYEFLMLNNFTMYLIKPLDIVIAVVNFFLVYFYILDYFAFSVGSETAGLDLYDSYLYPALYWTFLDFILRLHCIFAIAIIKLT